MKTLFTTLTLVLIAQLTIGQCREGSFIPRSGDPDYTISGDAKLEFLENGTKQVIYADNFNTVQGLELQSFLSVDDTLDSFDLQISTRELYVDEDSSIKGTPRQPITGSRTFPIPNSVGIDDYQFILLQCVNPRINALWGSVKLSSTESSSCNTLSTTIFTKEDLTIFPNPFDDKLKVQLKTLDAASFKFFNLHGQLVKTVSKTNTTNSQIDVSNLETGLYLLEITSNQKTGYQRLLKI